MPSHPKNPMEPAWKDSALRALVWAEKIDREITNREAVLSAWRASPPWKRCLYSPVAAFVRVVSWWRVRRMERAE